jgi:hypothetical protein
LSQPLFVCPFGEGPPFGPYTSPVEVLGEGTYGAEFEVALEDEPNRVGLVRDNHEFLVDAGIAEGNKASDPNSLAFRGGDPRSVRCKSDVADGLHLSQSHWLGMVLLLVQGSFG